MKIRLEILMPLLVTGLCFLTGCQQLASLEEQQAHLRHDLDAFTEETINQRQQTRANQRKLTEALITFCDEFSDLKNQVNEKHPQLQQAITDLTAHLATLQESQKHKQQTWQQWQSQQEIQKTHLASNQQTVEKLHLLLTEQQKSRGQDQQRLTALEQAVKALQIDVTLALKKNNTPVNAPSSN